MCILLLMMVMQIVLQMCINVAAGTALQPMMTELDRKPTKMSLASLPLPPPTSMISRGDFFGSFSSRAAATA